MTPVRRLQVMTTRITPSGFAPVRLRTRETHSLLCNCRMRSLASLMEYGHQDPSLHSRRLPAYGWAVTPDEKYFINLRWMKI